MWWALVWACVDSGSFTIEGRGDAPPQYAVEGDRLVTALEEAADRNGGRGGVTLRLEAEGWPLFVGAAGETAYGGEPMTSAAAFEIASVTKPFTAALVLTLVREGRFGLEDRIGPLFGREMPQGLLELGGIDLGPTIMVRELLTHTSGLPDYWSDPPFVARRINAFLADFLRDGDRRWQPREVLAYAAELDPIAPPGEVFHYSDTNYVLLGLLVEAVTGRPFAEALRNRVLRPLGLRHTWMVWDEGAPPGVVLSRRYEGGRDLSRFRHMSADWGGGGLASTTLDLATFLRRVGELLGPTLSEELLRGVPTGVEGSTYGLGVVRSELEDGRVVWGHDGYGGAFVHALEGEPLVLAGTINQTEQSADRVKAAALAAWAER